MININNTKKGLTLIEILVSLVIFVIMSVILGGVFVSMANLQEKITERNRQISELNFTLNYISNSIANVRDVNVACIPNAPPVVNKIFYNPGADTSRIRFLNKTDKCQEIFLEGKRIRTRISTDHTHGNLGIPIDLTSNIVTTLNFSLVGQIMGIGDNLQPKISVYINSNIEGVDIPMTVQTTVSKIKLDN